MSGTSSIRNKDMRNIVRQALDQGWRMKRRKSGHIKLIGPDGQVYFTGSTTSDNRAVKALRADLRRRGVKIR